MRSHLVFPLLVIWSLQLFGAGQDALPWRQDEPPNEPYSPKEALEKMTVPEGFKVELVASEPDLVNPIALSFDDQGRMWVTESLEYPRKPAGPGRDRVKVLEDTDADGRGDKVTIFAEGLNIPTGVAVGYGGVWVLNAPDLLYIKEKDGKEVSRQVVVTGFGRTDTHELPNSLTWGPDGWLYGLNGVFNQCKVRSNNGKEYVFNCALWRVHPRTHEFQIVAEGTSNPYGVAWDTEGSSIIEACHWANDHLFHFVETGHYQRQAGTFPPFTIPIGSITDHGHQKTAYCGLSFLDTDAFPEKYRHRIVVGNIHGGALNVDRLERDGCTYLAKGEDDLLNANDKWFMPVALKIGPDGSLYILDWYDKYHCSQDAARDPGGVDRLKGRLYRLRYKDTPRAPAINLLEESDDQLIVRLGSGNIFYRESAQRILTERLTESEASELRNKLEKTVLSPVNRKHRLQAMWTLIGSGKLTPEFHRQLLNHDDPTFRAWGVRAGGNYKSIKSELVTKISQMAEDSSPDVQLQVAIAAPKLDGMDALKTLATLLQRCGHDKIIPSIAWNNLHPLLPANEARFVSNQTVYSPAIASLAPKIVERFMAGTAVDSKALVMFLAFVTTNDQARANDCLSVVSSKLNSQSDPAKTALKNELKPYLDQILSQKEGYPLRISAQLLSARLGLSELDITSVRNRFVSNETPESLRIEALEALVIFRDPQLLTVLPQVLSNAPFETIRRAFISLGKVEDAKLAEVILAEYPKLSPELQPLAIDLIMQRERWARKLLDSVLAGKMPKTVLNANHLRKIVESNDREALWAVEKAFGKIREERNPQREKVVADMAAYLRGNMGDPHRGQAVFRSLCAQCHKLYGQGGDVGPDITGNGRASFDQLLSNILDPSLVIGPAYQVTTVVTKDGRNLTGLIAEDNDQRIVVKLPGEGEETIPRNNVKYTRLSKLSMMPEGLETSLDKKDFADLVAFLSLDKPPGDPTAKLIPGAPEIPKPSKKSTSKLKLKREATRLVVQAKHSDASDWIDLVVYNMAEGSRPYLHPVYDASGKVVLTQDRPEDHPWQHGIFTGFHGVNGYNYWKEDQGKQRFVRLLELKESDESISWRSLIELVDPNGKIVLEEENFIQVHAPHSSDEYFIDFDFLLRAKEEMVEFRKFYVGGLSVRMPWDKENPRQTHFNSNGLRNRACEQQRASWCNVERPFDDQIFGIAILDHPANPNHPPGWRADEQGLINPNVSALANWTLQPRQQRTFRNRIVIYQGTQTRDSLQNKFDSFTP